MVNLGIIFGGRSFEHEVSLISAQSIIKALDKKKYKILKIGITKDGQWLVGKRAERLLESRGEDKKLKIKNKKLKINEQVIKQLNKIDVFFPVLHGPYGEDGTIQGFFEMIDKPYLGAGVLSSSLGMDKVIQKIIFKASGLPVVDFVWFKQNIDILIYRTDILRRIKTEIKKKIGYPCFVKPSNSGSSVGIFKVHSVKELAKAVRIAFQYDQKIIIEKAVPYAREIEVSVLGNEKPIVSLPGEIVPSREFYDYQAKYLDGASKLIIPAKLSKSQIKQFQKLALAAYQSLDCQGMARTDFLMTGEGEIYLSEINTIPGFTSISMYPKLWEASGIPYPKLLDKLIEMAFKAYQIKKNRIWYTS